MSAALDHVEGRMRAASLGKLSCGMGQPASIIRHDKLQLPGTTSSLNRAARHFLRIGRVTRRGVPSAPVFSFRRGFVGTCDDVAESLRLRAAGLRDEQIAAVLSPVVPGDLQTVSIEPSLFQPVAEPSHDLERLSSSARYVEKHSEAGGQRIGNFGQVGAS